MNNIIIPQLKSQLVRYYFFPVSLHLTNCDLPKEERSFLEL